MKPSKLAIIILLIAVTTVFFGCGRVKPAIKRNTNANNQNKEVGNANSNSNVDQAINSNGNINTNTNETANTNQNTNANQNGNTNLNQNINQNSNTNINSATTTEEIDTSDWQTYRNEEYGFEIKYPANDWVSESPAYKGHMKSSGYVYHFLGLAPGKFNGDWSVVLSINSKKIDDFLGDPNYYWKKNWKVKERKSDIFGDIEIEVVTWSNDSKVLYIQNEGGEFTIEISGYQNKYFSDKNKSKLIDSVIRQMVESLKFN